MTRNTDMYDSQGRFIPDWESSPWLWPVGWSPPAKPKPRSLLNRILRHLCWFVVGNLLVLFMQNRKVYRMLRDAILVEGVMTAYDYYKQQGRRG